MEASNHFSFASHNSTLAVSGIKHSMGETLYTNGSAAGFTQQSKSLNGDLNVNGISTVVCSSASPSTPVASYPLMNSDMAYDVLFTQSQFSQEDSGASAPDVKQCHLNGDADHQPPTSSPSVTHELGGQLQVWSGADQPQNTLGYNSSSSHESYQSQLRPPPQQLHPGPVTNGIPAFSKLHTPPPKVSRSPRDTFTSELTEAEPTSPFSCPVSGGLQTGPPTNSGVLPSDTGPMEDVCQESDTDVNLAQEEEEEGEEEEILTPPLDSGDFAVSCEEAAESPLSGDQEVESVATRVLLENQSSPPQSPPCIQQMDKNSDISEGNVAQETDCSPSLSDLHLESFGESEERKKENDEEKETASLNTEAPSSCCSPESEPSRTEEELGEELEEQEEKATDESTEKLSLCPSPQSEPSEKEEEEEEEDQIDKATNESAVEEHLACCSPGPAPTDEEEAACRTAGEHTPRRRIATEMQVRFPLLHGWKREIRIRKNSTRLKGETWYYAPCGKRMKQFPEVIKYLSRHQTLPVSREHFSFSPRMPVGDFYEERETPKGLQWFMLANEEIPSMILAITGKRGRPRNPDKEKPKARSRPKGRQGPGRPPKSGTIGLLSKADARLFKKLQAQAVLSDEDKAKLTKLKRKMKLKARNKRKEATKAKAQWRRVTDNDTLDAEAREPPVKRRQRRRRKAVSTVEEEESNGSYKALEKKAQLQQRQEERKRQQLILEELKKPTEDMCITDHQPMPEFSHIPGLVLSGRAFSDCLVAVEFLHSYGKVLGLDVAHDVPNLITMQEGLMNVTDSLGRLLDLLAKLLQVALRDPGLPQYYQSVKILGERIVDLTSNRSTVSETLRIFLEVYGYDADVCDHLRTQPFQSLHPEKKAAILAFVVNELNGSNLVISEIDKTLENMATYRKNKWIIEGKLRRLRMALAKRTGCTELQASLDDRRRSTRITEDENAALEEAVLLGECRGSGRKEEPSEGESPSTASIPELERQIDKLTKRQIFFRKKLQHNSQTLRALSLGQDRYRRRYWVLPHVGGVLVEGSEETAAPEDPFIKEECLRFSVPVISPIKEEPLPEPPPPPPPIPSDEPEWDTSVSLMSQSRSRGRPRKIKPEVELHLKMAKARRRRRRRPSTNSATQPNPIQAASYPSQQDLNQSAFISWLNQSQSGVASDSNTLEPVKDEAETSGHWFNLLPKTPCDDSSLSQPCPATLQASGMTEAMLDPQCTSSTPSEKPQQPWRRGGLQRRRGRPPSKFLRQIEHKYFTQLVPQAVPPDMTGGWWWIQGQEEITALLQALHLRGIRERVLHKHLTKHAEYLREICNRPKSDPIFHKAADEDGQVSHDAVLQWSVTQRALAVDLEVLRWVEDLEQRVFASDLQVKGWTCPEPDSVREDLRYFEHHVEPLDDWIIKTKKEVLDYLRVPTHPLDLAVQRLAALERNIERRYLKEPLWNVNDVILDKAVTLTGQDTDVTAGLESFEQGMTARLRVWRQSVERCRSGAQLALCILQLERTIAWERSVVKVTCLMCRKGDDDECLLLCDGCDRGCHTYCLRPKIVAVPEGDWFCPVCVAKANGESPRKKLQRSHRRKKCYDGFTSGSSEDEDGPRRGSGSSRRRENPYSRFSVDYGSSPAKRRRMSTRNQPDLTYCEIILMEMESHDDAWPFLEPVNPRLVLGYRKIVKNPMDFLTMREKLLRGGYCSCEEFAADAQLVFDNCQLFNEDTSAVGMAGHSLRKFFESRWLEFYQGKGQDK
ncbi:bromodomain adjacent to zinc finger domain protein 2A isoform X2 [Polypterus senegalus]|uniref:bromodomain adjacent to zinc finger domain protein 2A isoform X2 n=1 Tax=Polypterus senegalus TaxID=55291 RepID=UPI0019627A4F|nr:bromodomain adjacent to zinc finger domain protein 2A isoform X2 [Polypterus senegalus]